MSGFKKIADGLQEAIAYAGGAADDAGYRLHSLESVDVKAVRRKLGLSQSAFAGRYGFTIGRIRDWEQNRSSPDTTSRLLLKIIDREPAAVERALSNK